MASSKRVGVLYDRALPPQGLMEFARAVEAVEAAGAAAGADSVVLRPFGQDPVGQAAATLAELR